MTTSSRVRAAATTGIAARGVRTVGWGYNAVPVSPLAESHWDVCAALVDDYRVRVWGGAVSLPFGGLAAVPLLYIAIALIVREATRYVGDNGCRCRVRTALDWPAIISVATIGTLIALVVRSSIESAKLSTELDDAKENHAAIEGTWTPAQLRAAKYQREQVRWDAKIANHAAFEGSTFDQLTAGDIDGV